VRFPISKRKPMTINIGNRKPHRITVPLRGWNQEPYPIPIHSHERASLLWCCHRPAAALQAGRMINNQSLSSI
jgi:hypothetical protein